MQLISMKDAPQQPLFDMTWRGFWRCLELWPAWALAKGDHSSEHSGRHGDDWSVNVTGSVLKILSARWEKSWNSCFKKWVSNNGQWISDITPTNLGHMTRFLFLGHIITSSSSKRNDGFTKRASAHQHEHIHTFFFFSLAAHFWIIVEDSTSEWFIKGAI